MKRTNTKLIVRFIGVISVLLGLMAGALAGLAYITIGISEAFNLTSELTFIALLLALVSIIFEYHFPYWILRTYNRINFVLVMVIFVNLIYWNFERNNSLYEPRISLLAFTLAIFEYSRNKFNLPEDDVIDSPIKIDIQQILTIDQSYDRLKSVLTGMNVPLRNNSIIANRLLKRVMRTGSIAKRIETLQIVVQLLTQELNHADQYLTELNEVLNIEEAIYKGYMDMGFKDQAQTAEDRVNSSRATISKTKQKRDELESAVGQIQSTIDQLNQPEIRDSSTT